MDKLTLVPNSQVSSPGVRKKVYNVPELVDDHVYNTMTRSTYVSKKEEVDINKFHSWYDCE